MTPEERGQLSPDQLDVWRMTYAVKFVDCAYTSCVDRANAAAEMADTAVIMYRTKIKGYF